MNENHLSTCCQSKKIKKDTTKFESDSNSDSDTDLNQNQQFTNQYSLNSNPLCETDNSKKNDYSPELKKYLVDNIDSFILNNKYNDEFEIIQNYLIDLLFLIKSKNKLK